jgi:putative ubiquitin-RnfH superfamily antitoxin RatB of RatAB toxin-antitoxin module
MTMSTKTCTVIYATAAEQKIYEVQVGIDATVEEVLAAARSIAANEDIPWDTAPIGIFGESCTRGAVPRNGDRIELYRPLQHDPRERRRAQVSTLRGRQPKRSGSP